WYGAITSSEVTGYPRPRQAVWQPDGCCSGGRGAGCFDRVRAPLAVGSSVVLRLDGLRLDLQVHALAHPHPACLQRHVPGHPPVLSLEPSSEREPGSGPPPRIRNESFVADVEVDRPRHVSDAEVAGDLERGRPGLLDPGAAEGDLRVMLDVQEI